MIAGEIRLHRPVIILEGTVALVIATVCLAVVLGGPGPGVGLLASIAISVPYVLVSGVGPERLRRFGLRRAWVGWLAATVGEEQPEFEPALDQTRAVPDGNDAVSWDVQIDIELLLIREDAKADG